MRVVLFQKETQCVKHGVGRTSRIIMRSVAMHVNMHTNVDTRTDQRKECTYACTNVYVGTVYGAA